MTSSPLRTDLLPRVRVHAEQLLLRNVAKLYRDAAGEAFAEGQDEKARAYRDVADALLKLAEELPELPPAVTRG